MDGSPSNEKFDNADMLSYEKVAEIISDCGSMGVKAIQITGGGEPLVHPRIYDILDDISGNFELALVTNGMALTPDISNLLVEHGSWIRISLDAATPETYSASRAVKQEMFTKTIENISYLVGKRNSTMSDLVIGIGFVVNDLNYKEIYQAVELASSLGVDNIRISGAFTPQGFELFKPFFNEARKAAANAKTVFERSNFTVFNLFDDRVKDTQEVQDYDFCPVKEIQSYIGADYNVYTCCTLAYNKKGLVGSIKDQRFLELWDSAHKEELFCKHNPKEICKLPCLYKSKNEFINYCIKKNPKHVAFI